MPHRVSEAEYRRLAKVPEPAPTSAPSSPEVRGSGRVQSSPRSVPARSISKPTGSYWGFMLTAIGVLLIAYLAGKGDLTKLINILIPKASDAPKFGGASTGPGGSYAPGTTQVPGSGSGVASTDKGGQDFLHPPGGGPSESDTGPFAPITNFFQNDPTIKQFVEVFKGLPSWVTGFDTGK